MLLGTAVVTGADAQEWPTARPIKFVVSQPAGSAPDTICRILTDQLSPALGQSIFVENKPGAGNIVGAQAAARAEPDGYTFFFATAAALATNPYTTRNLPYDPLKDFVTVGKIAENPFFILANAKVKANSLAEVVALDKADPGKLSIATEGPRNFSGILASWINRRAGTKLAEIPYNTIGQGIQDAIADRVQIISLPIISAVPFLKTGELKALAVSSSSPTPGFDNVPPISATVPGVELIGWFVLSAPAGTPPAAISRMNRELDKVLADPKIKQRFTDLGFVTQGAGTPEEAQAYVRSQFDVWGRVAKDIGLEPQ
jgi:tripartite-type tricarboxylate transporter receptor subunit TctC